MNEFTASNGVEVSSETQLLTGYRRIIFTTAGGVETFELSGPYAKALIESLDAEKDRELGRWRWIENPAYVVYPDEDGDVTVLDETTGRTSSLVARGELAQWNPSHGTTKAARAYFEAHPERKPWHDVKTGEVWVITVDGEESAWTVNNKDKFENPDSTYELTNPNITAARRIWPVSDD